MFPTRKFRAAALAICALMFVGCASGGSPATPPTPAAAISAQGEAAPTAAAPSTVATRAAQSNDDALATVLAMPTAIQATPDLPSPAPTITVGPTAAPFPLAAGWWDNAVCYEVFVRSFYDSDGDGIGDINGLIQKLDYINDGVPATQNDLGATCIWLMPIAESPSYHGYDTTDYYKVEPDYGSNDDFKRLVEAAHTRGIKIIIDLVLNHTSRDHPWFQSAMKEPDSPYRDWYLWSKDKPRYQSPWGSDPWHPTAEREYYYGIFIDSMPDLNYRNPAVTEEAHKISAFWLNDMGVDGFRLDAIKHLIENGSVQENTPETHAWLRDYRAFLEETKPGTFTVGEIFGANAPTLTPYYPDQLDDYFAFDAGYAIIDAANTGSADAFVSAVANLSTQLPFQRWAPFLTNHDQERVMSTLGDDTGKAKIAATALLTLPGLPFLYYGEEIGTIGTKPDELIRTPMQWAGDDTGGFGAGKHWASFQANYRQVNVAVQDADPDSLLNLYRKLIHLHTEHPALAHGSFEALKTSSPAVAAFVRQTDDEAMLVVLNFGSAAADSVTLEIATSGLAPGTYQLTPLLGDQPGADMIINVHGSVAGYTPLASLAAQTGYIFKLTQ
jgi:alpha-amylase